MMMMLNSKVGLGTAALGRPVYMNIRQEKSNDLSLDAFRQKGKRILDAAYDRGVRYYDTAPNYGLAEKMLIEWLLEKEDVSIEVATKWGYTYVANFDPKAILHEEKEHSLKKLNEQWDFSKSLLPYLSSYQIHSATIETGVLENEEILNCLAELKNKHDLFIGITTTGANQLEVLKKALDIEVDGEGLFNLYQVTYNVFDQSLSQLAEEVSKRKGRLVIKEALANGRVFPNEKYPHYAKAYQLLNQLAQKYEVGVDAIALQFCTESIPIYKVLSGAAKEQHLLDNLKVNDFNLSEAEIVSIKELAISPAEYWNERKQLTWS